MAGGGAADVIRMVITAPQAHASRLPSGSSAERDQCRAAKTGLVVAPDVRRGRE